MPKEMVKISIKSTPGGVESWRIYVETDDGNYCQFPRRTTIQ